MLHRSLWCHYIVTCLMLLNAMHPNQDEKHVQKVKKEIENMASIWRKRKRQCIEVIENIDDDMF